MKVALVLSSYLLRVFGKKYLVETQGSNEILAKPNAEKRDEDFQMIGVRRQVMNVMIPDEVFPNVDISDFRELNRHFKSLDQRSKQTILKHANMGEAEFVALDKLPSNFHLSRISKTQAAQEMVCILCFKIPGCFYKNSEVYTESGPKIMSELVLGDQVVNLWRNRRDKNV
eukprot:TRINITY_DN30460_c0_g1_i1.p1 TRINITY_DN30460_c0_g1~~TRINITY_DN30460_c0_g1_i1.p1  ORF type:complete len:193 (-),score=31.04 TRINITY_DN30460_c0_g1_i1:16-528(-)